MTQTNESSLGELYHPLQGEQGIVSFVKGWILQKVLPAQTCTEKDSTLSEEGYNTRI